MLIGSESHLSPNIMNSEMLPGNYRAARNDHNDGFGGVLVIYKKNLMVEENHFKFTGGSIVSINTETFKKSFIICACYRSPNNDNASNDNLTSNLLVYLHVMMV